MPSINVKRKDKETFDELKPEDSTQAEFFNELLKAKKRDNGQVVDIESMVKEINHKVASECEVAAYRGVADALERHGKQDS